jgi:hypothetical protein
VGLGPHRPAGQPEPGQHRDERDEHDVDDQDPGDRVEHVEGGLGAEPAADGHDAHDAGQVADPDPDGADGQPGQAAPGRSLDEVHGGQPDQAEPDQALGARAGAGHADDEALRAVGDLEPQVEAAGDDRRDRHDADEGAHGALGQVRHVDEELLDHDGVGQRPQQGQEAQREDEGEQGSGAEQQRHGGDGGERHGQQVGPDHPVVAPERGGEHEHGDQGKRQRGPGQHEVDAAQPGRPDGR